MRNELLLSFFFLILLSVFLNPLDIFMPPPMISMLIVILIVAFGGFTIHVWNEKPKDERETMHGMYVSRLALLLGSLVLIGGIIFQVFLHKLDPFLVYALGVIVLGKLISSVYIKKKN